MDLKRAKRFLISLGVVYWMLVVMIYFLAGERFHYTTVSSGALSPVSVVSGLTDGMELHQQMTVPTDRLEGISLMSTFYGDASQGALHMTLFNRDGQPVTEKWTAFSDLKNGKYTTIPLDTPVDGIRGQQVTLVIRAEGCAPDSSLAVYFGDTINVGRFDIAQSIPQEELFVFNGTPGAGKLCVKLNCIEILQFYKTYWLIVGGLFVMAAVYAVIGYHRMKKGKNSAVAMLCAMYVRYHFLIKQLVLRDFKTKYKRSVLGMAWSFLNPLLTMIVQYLVFSNLFNSDVPYYPVYLLSGIVFFNFFSEAVSMGMTSITSNASLIKKVYMPKYIFPVSKVLSSLVNFAIALIPLILMTLFNGLSIRPAILLLVFDILCLLAFVIGMVLLLSTLMTFFQDTQFLWGVISMMWMYLTPLFYPETIIPSQFLTLYHMNPMYQYITFARICIIDGASPEPMAYLWCIVPSAIVLLLGIAVFKKHQDKFVLYL